MQTISLQQQRKRKFYLILPIIVIPCLTLFFYALGGGKGRATAVANSKGLNTSLPEVQMNSEPKDKMSLYAQAIKDSNGFNELKKSDPYSLENRQMDSDSLDASNNLKNVLPVGRTGITYTDPNEQKVNDRLATLQRTLQQSKTENYNGINRYESVENRQLKEQLQAVQEQMHQMYSHQNLGVDPQIEQINTVLNKIMDVQHPDAVKERLERESLKNKGQVFSIASNTEEILAKPLIAIVPKRSIGFYGLTEISDSSYANNAAVEAQVHETQTLISGAAIKLRLTSDILIAGQTITKGSFVFGTCNVGGERLNITINSIRKDDRLFPVSLVVYDMDGLEGIRIPGAITREVTKEGIDQGIQSMNLMSLDPSVGAQAASAAVQTAKGLLGKKAKLVKATVRAGYPVLLLDKQQFH
ncbi:conjugative transposon protein TraM [Rhizosphaericola mali]|uniref:Conjugative transposon protein TraM n=1 Tax=Rhizosphaericola mali TaxID=2545455 RepID=A0A5P2G2I6_9BACT|nr:conjugative transposon protein TraM [Rhizosphaericola mali]QES88928.1 conjugative transposon protein TraM [Rhizosphaericola mali]